MRTSSNVGLFSVEEDGAGASPVVRANIAGLTHSVECLFYTEEAVGAKPTPGTNFYAALAQVESVRLISERLTNRSCHAAPKYSKLYA